MNTLQLGRPVHTLQLGKPSSIFVKYWNEIVRSTANIVKRIQFNVEY